jgi:predicted permease
VQAAGAIDALPLVSHESLGFLEVEGYANRAGQTANTWNVSGDYFRAMQIRLMAGRFLNDADMGAQPKAVAVSQSFARLYFNGRPAVGARIKIGGDGAMRVPWSTIVGVVADVRHSGLERPPAPTVYAASQFADTLAVRGYLAPDATAATIRKSLHEMDATIALADIRTMDDRISEAASRRRFQTALLAAFAAIAVALALAGLYGLLSYSVRQRSGEIGLRMALGASRADVVGMVVRQGLTLVALGLAVGLAAALALSSSIAKWLYGVRVGDLATLAAVPIFILAVGVLACAIPAWKAAKIDPATALRLSS